MTASILAEESFFFFPYIISNFYTEASWNLTFFKEGL